MDINQLQELIRKYNRGACSPEEKELIEQWYATFEWNKEGSGLSEEEILGLQEGAYPAVQAELRTVEREGSGVNRKSYQIPRFLRYAAAVSILIVAGWSVYYSSAEKQSASDNTISSSEDINRKPGSSKARLILADGKTVALDSTETTSLTEKDGTVITRQSGKLVYEKGSAEISGPELFNTISIPRGGEYRLVLPDGTKAWINAATTLRFPTRFAGNKREIQLTGEAYFEVTKNPQKPFRVINENGLSVDVLGTHFNVKAYADEADITTTLVEGRVKVTKDLQSVTLLPGRQAVWTKANQSLISGEADVDKDIAWKNGMFEFHEDDLPYIMKQLSRWYDVDVQFNSQYSQNKYSGLIERAATIDKVLEILEANGVKFKFEKGKLVVTEG